MIIKSLTLKNFRQFIGEQDIQFSVDPDKKATLIIAENATGKTTLLESFSWILYGEASGLKSIVNVEQANKLVAREEELKIEGTICLEHLGREYRINRWAYATKANTKVKVSNSYVLISYVDDDGNSKELRDSAARSLIDEIVPKDLFPYFFFQGENIEAIGQEISNGKTTSSGEFTNAIRGMLGFNWLYQEIRDLKKVVKQYSEEIENNKADLTIQEIQRRINDADNKIEGFDQQLTSYKSSLEKFKEEKKSVSDEILKSGNVAEKQKQSLLLSTEIKRLIDSEKDNKKKIFSDFSKQGYRLLAKSLIEESLEFLKEHGGDASKGIPGMNASAIEYVLNGNLNEGECFCGKKISENCEERKILQSLIQYLPPHSLGAEINTFDETGRIRCETANEYWENHQNDERRLRELRESIVNKEKQLEEIDREIKSFPDMTKKKQREQDLEQTIEKIHETIGELQNKIETQISLRDIAKKEKLNYKSTDEKVRKLEQCEAYASWLLEKVEKYCEKGEREKRKELQDAINEIFSNVFDVNIYLVLNDDYSMEIKSNNSLDLDDFQNSTSQDAILAFSFIGGIIKLAREKAVSKAQDKTDDDELIDNLEVEPYPLVMDAPSSSFDTKRIENFCKIMPNIAEQVIFFIKDTDGLYVKKDIANILGKEYTMRKTGAYSTIIEEV
ncbi:MAG: AAA family ATPase [Solobacterium sp.]|nr:AAA family ATPase [Solobacterium sp.]